MTFSDDSSFTHLNPSDINLDVNQPRRSFEPEKQASLTESIRCFGILENLVVRPDPDRPLVYRLVAGERRLTAAIELGLPTVPVQILPLTDSDAREVALVENLQREDLNPIEETESVIALLSEELALSKAEVVSLLYRIDTYKKKHSDATHNVMGKFPQFSAVQSCFRTIGRMTLSSFVSNRLPLLNLPAELQDALRQGQIDYSHARVIARLEDDEQRQALLLETIRDKPSLLQLKSRLRPPASSRTVNLATVQRRLRGLVDSFNLYVPQAIDSLPTEQVNSLLSQLELLLSTSTANESASEDGQQTRKGRRQKNRTHEDGEPLELSHTEPAKDDSSPLP